MAKFSDAVRATLTGYFNAGDQPTEAQFTALILAIQEGIEEHDHSGTGDGDGTGILIGPITVNNAALNTAAPFTGIQTATVKTAGATDEADDLKGLYASVNMNQAATVIGHIFAIEGLATLTDGTIGDGEEDLVGGFFTVRQLGGTAGRDASGFRVTTNLDAGIVTNDVHGAYIVVDIEAAMTSIGGDVFGAYILVDADQDPVGAAYGLYLNCLTNVDYGVYQAGEDADNYFAGRVGVYVVAPAGRIHARVADAQAIPVIVLEQNDISEGTINFIASDRGVIGEGTNSVKSIRVELAGVVYRLALYANA